MKNRRKKSDVNIDKLKNKLFIVNKDYINNRGNPSERQNIHIALNTMVSSISSTNNNSQKKYPSQCNRISNGYIMNYEELTKYVDINGEHLCRNCLDSPNF